jgi:hypothetical protein
MVDFRARHADDDVPAVEDAHSGSSNVALLEAAGEQIEIRP